MTQTYGYIRVSSTDQNEDRQLMAMREYSITEDRIYMDKLGEEFSTPAVSGAAQAAEARRSALYHQHRQAGPQL